MIDQQPSLAVVLRQKIGSQNTHYVHGLRGVQSQVVNSAWTEAMSDGLGSVRGWLNSSQAFIDTNTFDPYGVPDSAVTGFGFTGEMTDANGLVYLRARYYDPNVGVFTSLDPFEGVHNRPMSVNGYSWVEGNVANWIDPSGMSAICMSQDICDIIRQNPQNYSLMQVLQCLKVDECQLPDTLAMMQRYEQYRSSVDITDDFINRLRGFEQHPTTVYLYSQIQELRRMEASLALTDLMVSPETRRAIYHNLLIRHWIPFVQSGAELDVKLLYLATIGDVVWIANNFYRTDITGNIAYGYIGKYVGINENDLFLGGGLAQVIAGTQGSLECLMDDCADRAAINVGIDLINEFGTLWDVTELSQLLTRHISQLPLPDFAVLSQRYGVDFLIARECANQP